MMLWFALIVPVLTIISLLIFFRHQVAWWEPLVNFGPTALIILICKLTGEASQTHDSEWLTFPVSQIEHHEKYVREWEEYVPEVSHTDDKGKTVVDVPAHWETRTEYHPEAWWKITQNGDYEVSHQEYNRIRDYWGGERFALPRHPDQRHSWSCPKGINCNCSDGRGGVYTTVWPNQFEKLEEIASIHGWTNRMQASKTSVFRFPEVPKDRQAVLYERPRPDDTYRAVSIIGPGFDYQADRQLARWNAVVGPRPSDGYKQACKIWILLYKGHDMSVAIDQESLWKGGKKNEFTVCIGLDDKNCAKWSYIISWTEAEELKVKVRDHIVKEYYSKPIDLMQVVNYVGQACLTDYTRKHGHDWDYLTVEAPTWAYWVCWVITILSNIGLAFVVVNNDCTSEQPVPGLREGFYRRAGYRRNYYGRS